MLEADSAARWVVMDLRGDHRPQADGTGGPLAQVCGMPVLVRNLLLLQRAGAKNAVVLCQAADRPLVECALAAERRLRLEIVWAISETELLEAVEPLDSLELVYWPGALSFGRRLPWVATAPLSSGTAALLPLGADGTSAAPAVVAKAELAALSEAGGLPALIERLAGEGRAQQVPLELAPRLVTDAAAVRAAEAELLRSLRKDVDGAVAKFDRYISLAISRRLMRLPITPNQVTVLAGLLGVACGLLASVGGYWPMLLAALGFQLNSILDGIDGEIARAKLLESRLGQWLDTLADDSSNLAYSVGVCVGCYRTFGSSVYLGLAVVTGAGFVITAALMYRYIITVAHSGDLNDFKMPWEEGEAAAVESAPPTGLAAVLARLKFVVRRDTFVFLSTCFALLGELRVMAWLFAIGATAVWLSIVGYRVLLPARSGGA
jgi:phosphatidylglycerophosphate synthase